MSMPLRTSIIVAVGRRAIVARPRRFDLVALIVAAVAVLGHSGVVLADDDPLGRPTNAEARAHLEHGEALYALQKWDEAIAELEQGALSEPGLPMWFLSLGQAHRQAGHYERARWYYERFLSRVEGVAGADEIITTVRGLIADMKAAESRPPVDLAPTSPQSEPTRSASSRWTTSRKVALGVGAGGLVAVGVGLVLTVRARGLEDDASALCPMVACADATEANELALRADSSNQNAAIAYGIGGAAIVGTVVLWLVGAPEHNENAAISAIPLLSPSFAGIDVRMRF